MTASSTLLDELSGLLGERQVSAGSSDLVLHGEDLSFHPTQLPQVVVYPRHVEDVRALMGYANDRQVAVVPFGAGSSLDGHIIPMRGGVSLDMTRMNRIVEIQPKNMTVTVEAGVTRLALEKALAEHGLLFGVDPGADATLGGMAATNAAGTMTVRYGKMRPQILAIEAVLPGGQIINTGSRAAKTSAGYDITGLLVGSEGTLAVITTLVMRVHGIPEDVLVVRASFPNDAAACGCAQGLVAAGLQVQRVEFIDSWEAHALNHLNGTDLPVAPILIVELAGSPAGVVADQEVLQWLLDEAQAFGVEAERDPGRRARLWRARHDLFFAEKAMAPGKQSMSTDVCVPLNEVGAAVVATRAAMTRLGLEGGICAHAGDGNVHAGVLFDPTDEDEMLRVDLLRHELVADAIARGGTSSGEHGIGIGKIGALASEHGEQLTLMRGIKSLFDPAGIMNPGKMIADCRQIG